MLRSCLDNRSKQGVRILSESPCLKAGPTIEGKTATLTASLQHATIPGPAVTWTFRFEQNADGTWNAVSHK